MFEKFMSTNAGDFRQRYRGTYGFYSNAGRRILVRLTDVSVDRGLVVFEDAQEQTYRLNVNASEDIGFVFIPPKSAWHNTENGVYFVRRVPARQFQRGICEANTYIRRTSAQAIPVGFEALSSIFEKAITPKAALKSGEHAISVSPQFAVDTNINRIWLFDQMIGTASKKDDHFSITLYDPETFGVEVTDAFKRAEIEATIK